MKTTKPNKKTTPPKAPTATPAAPPAAVAAQPSPASAITTVANGSNKGTKVDLQAAYSTLSTGLQASYPADYVFDLISGEETCADLVGQFQQFINAAEETKTALTAYRAAVQKERTILLQVQPLRAGVKNILLARYGRSGAPMRSFGWTPLVPKPATPAEKAAAAVKAKATKAARGTKGKVQREQIQGNVVGVVMTPVTATLSTSTTGAPAAQSSSSPATPPAASTTVTKP